MRRLFVSIAACLVACSAEPASDSKPPIDPPPDGGSAGDSHSLFSEDFEGVDHPPYESGYPTLPQGLFPDDGSRWTNIQDTHPGQNDIGLVDAHGGKALASFAGAEAAGEASKMDLGKEVGLSFRDGDVVRLQLDLFVDGAVGEGWHNTLFDLEDTNDIALDGQTLGPGLRVKIGESGQLALDRGELVGSDGSEAAHFVLSGMYTDLIPPTNQWVTIETIVKLGFGVTKSTVRPIDDSFDEATTAAWCKMFYAREGEEKTLVLRMKGTTYLDRVTGMALVARAAPGSMLIWPEAFDFNAVQVGTTNNRSTRDQRFLVDNVFVEMLDEER